MLHLGFTALCDAVLTLFLLKQRQWAVFRSSDKLRSGEGGSAFIRLALLVRRKSYHFSGTQGLLLRLSVHPSEVSRRVRNM